MSNESEVFLPDLLHCTVLEEMTDGTYLARGSNESTGSASIRKRLPFRSGNFWNSQASNRMFRCRTRPSTRTRRRTDRTIQDSNHENKRNKRKPT